MTYVPPGAPIAGPADAGTTRSLRRSRSNRVLAGVLGGVAEHINADPVVLRVLFICGSVLTGGVIGPLAYVLAWAVMPEEGGSTSFASETVATWRAQ
ncbi:MAG TPA: PspC domain-containing protein [Acidimicrobiales bacterium]|nr:PspC domain-containing protein [Acidimicrobiales bacterium]